MRFQKSQQRVRLDLRDGELQEVSGCVCLATHAVEVGLMPLW
jgi:hypothetical protein